MEGQATKPIMKKVILPIFIFIILIEVIMGVRTLRRPLIAVNRGESAAPIQRGKIALVASKTNLQQGDNVDVAVRVSTGGHSTDGTDIYLKYDPSFLQAAGQTSFTKGSIYTDYPVVSIDNNSGTVRVSGISSFSQAGFNGLGDFGVLTFKAIKNGTTSLRVEYSPASTTLSNIIESSTASNLLDSASNLDLTIGSNSVSSTPTSCSARVYSTCKDDKGRIGNYWCTSISDSRSCSVGCFKDQTSSVAGCKIIVN